MKRQLAFLVAGLVVVLVLSGQLARAAAGPAPNDVQDSLPGWASDGVHLAFERTGAPGLQHVLELTSSGRETFIAAFGGVFRGWVPGGEYKLVQSGANTIITAGGRFSGPHAELHGVDATASADGSRVAYLRDGTLYVARIDGLPPSTFPIPVPPETAIATGIAPPADDIVGPVWSPDGSQIAVASGNALLLVRSDGSGTRALSGAGDENTNPSWSHDGSMLAWERHDKGHWTLWYARFALPAVNELEGTGQSDSRFPQFSPVSDTVAFISDREHLKGGATPYQYALYLTDDAVRLGTTEKLFDDVHPYSPARWSPSAALIAVAAGRECRRWGIYIARTDLVRHAQRRSNICRFDGTASGDRIHGTPYFDIINGRGGADVLLGDAGDDRISGENGNDTIAAGPGDDVLLAGPGDDRVYGGPGDDVIVPGNGRDRVDCGPGNDTVEGAGRLDRIARNCEHVRR